MQAVHPSVKIEDGAIIGENVTIGEKCKIGAYSIITGDTHIGSNNVFYPHTIIGGDPQDLKFKGGGKLTIGNGNTFREFSTVHRGHLTDEGTVIKDNNHFLTNAHVGHDCKVGNYNFIANNVLMAGHVELGNYINVSGNAGFHQFCKVGDHVMISGLSGVRQDVLPYALVQGDPAKILGINSIGLKRRGMAEDDISKIKEAFRMFRNKLSGINEYSDILLDFKMKSNRGIISFKSK
jgi:UDP-N-acetylglucosamine acyltransferase